MRFRATSPERERTALWHRFEGILAEVEQDLRQLLLVGSDQGEFRREDLLELDTPFYVIGHLGSEDLGGQRGKRGRLKVELLRAGQCTPPLEKGLQAVNLLLEILYGRTQQILREWLLLGLDARSRSLHGSRQAIQGIADFMGELGRGGSDGGKTFALAEFFLGALALSRFQHVRPRWLRLTPRFVPVRAILNCRGRFAARLRLACAPGHSESSALAGRR